MNMQKSIVWVKLQSENKNKKAILFTILFKRILKNQYSPLTYIFVFCDSFSHGQTWSKNIQWESPEIKMLNSTTKPLAVLLFPTWGINCLSVHAVYAICPLVT